MNYSMKSVDRTTHLKIVIVGIMLRQAIQRANSHAPRYGAVEILMIAAGVLLIVGIAFVI
jgi:hypothetical protein